LITPSTNLKALHPVEIGSQELPPVDWIVKGLFSMGDKVLCAGESRSFKTWVLVHMCLHVAAGKDWLGMAVPKPRKVLYVDEEMNEATLRRRIKLLAKGAGIELDNKLEGNLLFLNQQGWRLHEAGSVALLKSLEKLNFNPELVVAESVVRIMVGNENSAADVGAFWRNCTPLTTGSQRSVLLSHHLAKTPMQIAPHKNNFDRTRGSGDFGAGCDVHFSLTRPSTAFNFTKLILEKSREEEEKDFPPLTITKASGIGSVTLKPSLSPPVKEHPQGYQS
jgi:RecA-family ATPase